MQCSSGKEVSIEIGVFGIQAPKTIGGTPANGGNFWANLVAGNTFVARGMGLTYVAPMIQNGEKIVELQQAEVEKETEKWKMAVILYVVRDTLSIGAIERFITSQWNFIAKTGSVLPK